MPRGAVIINPGRGPLIDDHALLAALEQKHISAACLDVFRVEPLPQDHPYWHLPNVTVTPHIASGTRPATAAEVLVENVVRGECRVRHFCIWSTEQRGTEPQRAAPTPLNYRKIGGLPAMLPGAGRSGATSSFGKSKRNPTFTNRATIA